VPGRRLVLLAVLVALAALALSKSSAQAAPPSPTAALAQAGDAVVEPDGSCTITLVATWDSSELRGPHTETRLYEQVGGSLELRAAGFRVPDTGTARFVMREVGSGAHTYVFRLVRGGQERVLADASSAVDCH
jgi:hypothetical protein